MIQKISDNAKGWQTKVEGGTRISHKLSWEADLDAENCGYLDTKGGTIMAVRKV